MKSNSQKDGQSAFSDLLTERKYGVLGQNREAIFGKKMRILIIFNV